MSVYTYKIENNLDKNGGNFEVDYSISVNSSILNVINIKVEVEKIK